MIKSPRMILLSAWCVIALCLLTLVILNRNKLEWEQIIEEAAISRGDITVSTKRTRRVSDSTRTGMQIAVSVLCLLTALYIILSQRYDAKEQHWAYGVVGTILGFWLRK